MKPMLLKALPCAVVLALSAGCAVDGDVREGGYPVAAAATEFGETPPALADLVGARAGQAEGALTQRGYEYRTGSKSDTASYTNWEELDSGRCVTIRTEEGRYQSIIYGAELDCQSGAQAGVASPETGPTEYDASGKVPCATQRLSLDQQCGFRVIRGRGGSADIWIENIARDDSNPYQVLYFANDQFSNRANSRLTWEREGDEWVVGVEGGEFYRIPDALIYGG